MKQYSTLDIPLADRTNTDSFGSTRERDLCEYLEKYFSLSAREEAIRQRRLYSIEIELTKACNLECPYCYSNACSESRESLPLDVVRRLLHDAYEYGIRSVSWFGGEPLLYPHLFEVLAYARELGYSESILYTNGTLITGKIAAQLHELVDTVAVHLDTLSSEAFQTIHNKKPASQAAKLHSATLLAFDNLLDAGCCGDDIRLTLTLCRPTYQTLGELLSWAFGEKEIQTSIFIPIAPFGRGAPLGDEWHLTQSEIEQAYKWRAEAEQRPYLLMLGDAEYCKQYQMTMCYISVSGDIVPYAGSILTCGNIQLMPFSAIIMGQYEKLAFKSHSYAVSNASSSTPCAGCLNSQYCFGTPVVFDALERIAHGGQRWCYQHSEG